MFTDALRPLFEPGTFSFYTVWFQFETFESTIVRRRKAPMSMQNIF